jgi:hypothetical protein
MAIGYLGQQLPGLSRFTMALGRKGVDIRQGGVVYQAYALRPARDTLDILNPEDVLLSLLLALKHEGYLGR